MQLQDGISLRFLYPLHAHEPAQRPAERGLARAVATDEGCDLACMQFHPGLLDGRTAATHWLAEDDFVRRFPKIHLDTNRLYVEDGNFLTSAGAAGGLDCCLYLIRKIHGATVANDLARTLVAAPHREGGQAQFIHRPVERRTADDKINHLLDELRQNLATPYRLDDLAKKLAVSRRTFIRHFSQATGMNFGEWLTTERLWQVQDLLENTNHPIQFGSS